MKFMTTQSWFRLTYHAASPKYPHYFDLPDSEEPATYWIPLDQKAADALKKLSLKKGAPTFTPSPIKLDIDLSRVTVEVLPALPDPNRLPPPKKEAANTLSEIQKAGRPSDREPTR
jgi:hypothetical protein